MTQKWVWLQQEAVFLAQIEQLSTLGTGSLSRDAANPASSPPGLNPQTLPGCPMCQAPDEVQRHRDATVFTDPAPERRKTNPHTFKGLDGSLPPCNQALRADPASCSLRLAGSRPQPWPPSPPAPARTPTAIRSSFLPGSPVVPSGPPRPHPPECAASGVSSQGKTNVMVIANTDKQPSMASGLFRAPLSSPSTESESSDAHRTTAGPGGSLISVTQISRMELGRLAEIARTILCKMSRSRL
uniref:mucin-7-like n=1 Tax=Panthera onca TaxID=9690 RepID=UPI00295537C8|nr:mucin-7-like [Panthera onca]